MKKKLDTRFPAARIKKIMQSDQDVGKIAMAVPLLVFRVVAEKSGAYVLIEGGRRGIQFEFSQHAAKALELFLQDLCDRTYCITTEKGAKTLNSFHLKQCVENFNVFDFLKEIVNKVPDLGGHDVAGDDASASKRRKVDNTENVHGEDPISNRVDASHNSESGRGRGWCRGHGQGTRAASEFRKFEDDPDVAIGSNNCSSEGNETEDLKTPSIRQNAETKVLDFDLNVDLNESCKPEPLFTEAIATSALSCSSEEPSPGLPGQLLGWSPAAMGKIEFDPAHITGLHRRLDEDEEDYDKEP